MDSVDGLDRSEGLERGLVGFGGREERRVGLKGFGGKEGVGGAESH